MKIYRQDMKAAALDNSTQAFGRLHASFESLPAPLRQDLRRQIASQVRREAEFRGLREAKKQRELGWMTKALICARVPDAPELRESSQRFLEARVEYLNLGGDQGLLGGLSMGTTGEWARSWSVHTS